MALTQISHDPTLAEVIHSATTAAFSSRDKVMLRSRDITEHPAAVAVVVGILAILTLVICLCSVSGFGVGRKTSLMRHLFRHPELRTRISRHWIILRTTRAGSIVDTTSWHDESKECKQ